MSRHKIQINKWLRPCFINTDLHFTDSCFVSLTLTFASLAPAKSENTSEIQIRMSLKPWLLWMLCLKRSPAVTPPPPASNWTGQALIGCTSSTWAALPFLAVPKWSSEFQRSWPSDRRRDVSQHMEESAAHRRLERAHASPSAALNGPAADSCHPPFGAADPSPSSKRTQPSSSSSSSSSSGVCVCDMSRSYLDARL